jgi:ABC-type uncharacterized transport system involved in gliding motility auxiliary subunit
MSSDDEANASYWGSRYNPRDILNKRATTGQIQPLLSVLNDLIKKSGR